MSLLEQWFKYYKNTTEGLWEADGLGVKCDGDCIVAVTNMDMAAEPSADAKFIALSHEIHGEVCELVNLATLVADEYLKNFGHGSIGEWSEDLERKIGWGSSCHFYQLARILKSVKTTMKDDFYYEPWDGC